MPPMFPVRIDPNDVLKHPHNWEEVTQLQAYLRYTMIPVVMVTHDSHVPYAQLMTPMGNWGFYQVIDPHARFYSQVGNNHLPSAIGPVPHTMTVSKAGVSFLRVNEGIAGWDDKKNLYFPYLDSQGFPTIGIGHLIVTPQDFSKGLTVAQVEALFQTDQAQYADPLSKQLKVGVSQQQFDALFDLEFNMGPGTKQGWQPVRILNAGSLVTEESFTVLQG